MNPGESVVYRQRPCVVLDHDQEGYSLEEGQALLEDVTHYATHGGRVRHLANFDSGGQESASSSPDPSS